MRNEAETTNREKPNKMTFQELINLEIEKLGGGWWARQMYIDNPVKFSDYKISYDTMFDIDVKNFGVDTNMIAFNEFWKLIYDAQVNFKWKWLYKCDDKPELAAKLKELVAEMIWPRFDSWCSKFLSLQSQKIVESDSKLTFNFIYAVFNGIGWFKYFSNALNIYVDRQNITDPEILIQKMIEERLNSGNALIIQGGNTIKTFINEIV